MGQTEIDLTRWLVYLIVGVPAIVWLLFTRNTVLRLIALLGILVFVQDTFASRRIVFGVGLGPSVILLYATLMGLFISKGRLPSLGVLGLLWLLFLGAALVGLVAGSLGTGMLFWNIRGFQQLYFEGFFYFIVGVMAFDRDDDARRFLFYYVIVIGTGVAASHLFALGTGWRPPSPSHTVEAGRQVFYGGVFVNPNTLGAFYAMTIPVALLLLLQGVLHPTRRLILAGGLVLMGGSLILTGSRGGLLFTAVVSFAVLLLLRPSIGRVLTVSILGLGVFGGIFGLVAFALPGFFDETLRVLFIEGLSTNRFVLWGKCIQMILEHPLGVGLSSWNFLNVSGRYGIPFATAHNIYLDHAVYAGFLGLAAFLGLVAPIVTRNLRVLRAMRDPQDVLLYGCLFAVVTAFLLGGLVEPIYHNSYRLSQVFWLFAGLSLAASARAFASAAAASPQEPISSDWQASRETGFENG